MPAAIAAPNAAAIVAYATLMLGTPPQTYHVRDNVQDYAFYVEASDLNDPFLAAATVTEDLTVTAYSGNGSFKADYSYGTPANIFTGTDVGFVFDPNDFSTLYQDLAGQTPVTTHSQPVAIMLDKSQNRALGPDLRSTFILQTDGVATPATFDPVTGVGTATRVDIANRSYVVFASPTGTICAVDIENTGATTIGVRTNGTGTSILTLTPGQRKTVLVPCVSGNLVIISDTDGATGSFKAWSINRILGNHANQATPGSRPLSARMPLTGVRNLAIGSASTTVPAYWQTSTTGDGITATLVGSGVDADGVPYADYRYTGTSGTITNYSNTYASATSRTPAALGQQVTGSCTAQLIAGSATNVTGLSVFVIEETAPTTLIGGSSSAYSVSTSETPLSVTRTINTGNQVRVAVFLTFTAAQPIDVTYRIKGLQMEKGAVKTAYQFNYSPANITEPGVPDVYGLYTDGVDDFMVTNVITPASDKVQAIVGTRKLADAGTAIILESSVDGSANPGTVGMFGAITPPGIYGFRSKGDAVGLSPAATTAGSSIPPDTSVLSGAGDVSADYMEIRVNGVIRSTSPADQGNGGLLAYPVYLFSRGSASARYNGVTGRMMLRFGPNLTDAQRIRCENWCNAGIGAY